MINYLILIVVWVIYYFLHSVLASNEVKEQLTYLLNGSKRMYRLLYSFMSIVGLTLIGLFIMVAPSERLFETGGWGRYSGMVLASWGVIIMTIAFREFSMLEFLGVRDDQSDRKLVKEGIHGRIRHPLYAGTILILLGMFLFIPTDMVGITCLITFIYIPVGIKLEEDKLLKKFGEEYRQYKASTAAILPGIW